MYNQYYNVLMHYKAGVSMLVPKNVFTLKKFWFVVILFMLCAIASPDIFSSNKHSKYLTLECCLICISPYFKLKFLMFFLLNLEAKSILFCLILTKVYT